MNKSEELKIKSIKLNKTKEGRYAGELALLQILNNKKLITPEEFNQIKGRIKKDYGFFSIENTWLYYSRHI